MSKTLKIAKEKIDKLFFTSDLHFYHKDIIYYDQRPFKDLDDMHFNLIKNWNSVVPENGMVVIAGDFALTQNKDILKDLLNSLNGKKFLVFGNHDYQNKFHRDSIKSLFDYNCDILSLKIPDEETKCKNEKYQEVIICHYPFASWAGSNSGSWNLFGHVHSKPDAVDLNHSPNALDVGVVANNYTPISYSEVKRKIFQQNLVKSNS